MLPIYNFHELPFIADSGYAKGGGWKLIVQSGVFKYPGLLMLISGVLIFCLAKILPKKYWVTSKDFLNKQKENGKRKKQNKISITKK